MTTTHWTILGALLLAGCAGHSEPAPKPPSPAQSSEPSPVESSTPKAEPSAKEEPAAEPAAEGPKTDHPAWASIPELSPDRQKQLPDGFYFVDGVVTRLPCNACAKGPACKPGEQCEHTKPCSYCNATVIIEYSGHDISIDHPDRDNVPKYRLNERVRIVLEKKGLLRWFVKKSKPCPPSECLETEPAKRLEKPAKGVEVRHDGERCFAPEKCAPDAKCDPDKEVRVRCP